MTTITVLTETNGAEADGTLETIYQTVAGDRQVEEAIRYCEANRSLLEAEAEMERRHLLASGVRLEPEPAAG